jgi:hypothetical protein
MDEQLKQLFTNVNEMIRILNQQLIDQNEYIKTLDSLLTRHEVRIRRLEERKVN